MKTKKKLYWVHTLGSATRIYQCKSKPKVQLIPKELHGPFDSLTAAKIFATTYIGGKIALYQLNLIHIATKKPIKGECD